MTSDAKIGAIVEARSYEDATPSEWVPHGYLAVEWSPGDQSTVGFW